MIVPVSAARWQAALDAESAYWSTFRADAQEFVRVLREKVEAAEWLERVVGGAVPGGEWLEIGIGPFGVGCIHFLRGAQERSLVGVEPLGQLAVEELEVPTPLVAVVERCRAMPYVQLEATGERTGLEDERFDLACCYNVLDQVHDAATVLSELHRVLRPSGTLLLGCNTVSLASVLAHDLYGRRRHAGSLGETAHTFRFRVGDLRRMVLGAGFLVQALHVPRAGRFTDFVGRSRRTLVVAVRPGGARE